VQVPACPRDNVLVAIDRLGYGEIVPATAASGNATFGQRRVTPVAPPLEHGASPDHHIGEGDMSTFDAPFTDERLKLVERLACDGFMIRPIRSPRSYGQKVSTAAHVSLGSQRTAHWRPGPVRQGRSSPLDTFGLGASVEYGLSTRATNWPDPGNVAGQHSWPVWR